METYPSSTAPSQQFNIVESSESSNYDGCAGDMSNIHGAHSSSLTQGGRFQAKAQERSSFCEGSNETSNWLHIKNVTGRADDNKLRSTVTSLHPSQVAYHRPSSLSLDHQYPVDCSGRRRQPIGEKCFAFLILVLVLGITLTAFGATCIIPLQVMLDKADGGWSYCLNIGGLVTALVLTAGGSVLLIVGIIACVMINECSDRELHGGKCHINCRIFDDLISDSNKNETGRYKKPHLYTATLLHTNTAV